ncbi:DNA cytosine methyltransferase [Candidatus Thiodictyon syntrophicum]|jgi:DNA (cytosine-5)-methyltransferase 1|uniref:Cytosine-specific methyltransferase n=1 Tax=Candidatus Thiodictyon syntrophicum TaxID=1166950 RepID=A0A2K8UH89_9GAMM|nr:DNA (cytosine-5-)-methyltransferase [Candidatus Thiodictyon syntrophicum]AUB84920.1 DNA (cytosine-5-)-methyltransferase [Candidatus Thiodictyon syntrophicum]
MSPKPSAPLTTVELFSGIGGFRIAADSLAISTVWANDISPLACAVYRDRFGADVLQEGDIKDLISDVPVHDILTAGFPCQPFSAAGKKEGIRDPRGTLFQSIVDVIQEKQPQHFVLENVKRLLSMEHGAHFATVLSALSALDYFIEWRILNAKDFGLAQNRERVFVVGTKVDSRTTKFGDVRELLRLAGNIDLASGPRGIGGLLAQPSNWKPLNRYAIKFPFWGVALNGKCLACGLDLFSAAMPLTYLQDVLETTTPAEYDYTIQTLARIQNSEIVDRFVNGVEIISNQAGGARMGYTIFGIGGLAPTLTASTSRHYERYKIDGRYRRLTPVEYARLQGFADDHCSAATNYDQYMLYGNAVPPPLATWVLSQLTEDRAEVFTVAVNNLEYTQLELFSA